MSRNYADPVDPSNASRGKALSEAVDVLERCIDEDVSTCTLAADHVQALLKALRSDSEGPETRDDRLLVCAVCGSTPDDVIFVNNAARCFDAKACAANVLDRRDREDTQQRRR